MTHSFPANSPVVGAADPNPANGTTTDQRLAPRPAAAGDRDIGAVERVNAPFGPDSDGDGLPDIEESAIGLDTDPRNPDTDGDGTPDGSEFEHGLDPKVANATDDADGDLATNGQEYLFGTNPRVRDGVTLTVSISPLKVLIDDPPADRSLRLQRCLPANRRFFPITEWKTFDPANPEPGGDGFPDPATGADFILWRIEVSPLVPPPP